MTDPLNQPINPYANQRQLTPEQMQQQMHAKELGNRLKEQIVTVFANPHGMQLIETLIDAFVLKPVCPPGCPEGYGYSRDAENRFILMIKNIVEQAQNPVPQ